MNIDKQALREVAERAMHDDWGYDTDIFHEQVTPSVVLALLDELKSAENSLIDSECHVAELEESLRDKQALLEAAEKRIAEQSKAASVDSQWKPEVCPITGRRFFMWIEHPSLGYVPTYGGPFDSYTIPTRDSSGEFSCERYDHDFGGWVEGEFIGLYLIDDDEQCRVCELEERIAELEARKVMLPDRKSEIFWPGDAAEFDSLGYVIAVKSAIRAAGIKVKG
ncbi:ead/Ea22-like family protein [Salmonella enterica]|nr:ead/Ea22-like family protein [Salmonella enterica]